MGSTLTLTCSSCGDQHKLFLAASKPDPATHYEFVCPEKGVTLPISGPAAWKPATDQPTGALMVVGAPHSA